MRWKRSGSDKNRPVDEREWSARPSSADARPRPGLVANTALPAETGPTWAPDELSIWPVEGGRYGLDAHYHGATGAARARHQQTRLAGVNLAATVRSNDHGGSTLRLGPLQHRAAWLALEAFLGRPIDAAVTLPDEPVPDADR
jgi:hypothetical protein